LDLRRAIRRNHRGHPRPAPGHLAVLFAPCPEKDPWLPSTMIARRIPRKRRQKVSMRRINPIEWTSGCLHSPAAEAGAPAF